MKKIGLQDVEPRQNDIAQRVEDLSQPAAVDVVLEQALD
jgi:hypothetical protein